MDLNSCFQGGLAHSGYRPFSCASVSVQQWFSRLMVHFTEYHISCHTGAENRLWDGAWRKVASYCCGGQKPCVSLYTDHLAVASGGSPWAANTSLGFRWSRVTKHAPYLYYVQSSFQSVVCKDNDMYHADTVVVLK